MSNEFQPLESDIVVTAKDTQWFLLSHKTFTTDEMMQSIKKLCGADRPDSERAKWFNRGVECRILQPGSKGWQNGRVRVHIEFCPDEVLEAENDLIASASDVDSPLDEIRQMISEGD